VQETVQALIFCSVSNCPLISIYRVQYPLFRYSKLKSGLVEKPIRDIFNSATHWTVWEFTIRCALTVPRFKTPLYQPIEPFGKSSLCIKSGVHTKNHKVAVYLQKFELSKPQLCNDECIRCSLCCLGVDNMNPKIIPQQCMSLYLFLQAIDKPAIRHYNRLLMMQY